MFLSSNNNNNDNSPLPTETSLFEFALRLSATIIYIMIWALRPKKFYLDRKKELVELNTSPIKGSNKDSMALDWVNNAIKPEMILSEFRRLGLVERGLPVFIKRPIKIKPAEIKDSLHARKASIVNDPNISLIIEKQFLEKQRKVGEFKA